MECGDLSPHCSTSEPGFAQRLAGKMFTLAKLRCAGVSWR
jgi:hypothetical protein